MNNVQKTVGAIFVSMITLIARADDTDIFLGNGAYQDGVLPNVLFILDNSGSMNSTARDADGNSTGQTRLEAMKSAFGEIMDSVTGVNIGLMRFNAPGGSIMYPVTNADAVLGSNVLQTNPDMKVSGDDAVENQLSGSVRLDDDVLQLGFTPAANIVQTVRVPIVHQDDDHEERLSSGARIDASHYNMHGSQMNGLRYLNLGIPKGATIMSASLDFYSPSSGYTGDIVVEIKGQYADNPSRFSSADFEISSRWNLESTAASVTWNIPAAQSWDYNMRYTSPDLSSIIQEIIDHPDWDENDALVLMTNNTGGSGQRAGTLYRNDTSSTQGLEGTSTHLNIEYSMEVVQSENLAGLRFQDVNIPQGATIDNAYIHFISSETNGTSDGLQLKVRIEDSDNAAAFTNGTYDLSARNKRVSEVLWSPEDTWEAETSITGPEVTTLVQQVVNRAGWCGNNSMAFYIEPTVTSPVAYRRHYAFDDGITRHAELVVNYTDSGAGSSCVNEVWQKRVNSGEDDAEQNSSGGVTNNSNDLDIENSQYIGMRFENLPIAQGATLLSAHLELTSFDDDSGSMYMDIYAHDTNNSAAFPNSANNLSNRTLTSASVRWSPVDWEEDEVYPSPDITPVVQAVINRGGWEPGNALSLIMRSSSGGTDRDAYTYNTSPAKAPRLVLKVANGGISQTDYTVKEHLNDLVQNMEARTWTPIVDSLYESALYYRGSPVHYGASRELFAQIQGNTDKRFKRVSVADSYTGGTHVMPSGCTTDNLDSTNCRNEEITSSPTAPRYISPIVSDCQTNHIVLLTDGEANNNNSEALIETMVSSASSCSGDASDQDERCGRTLAEWMANNDMMPSLIATNNTIKTHTIAFNLSNSGAVTFLQDLADEGDGGYHSANTAAELADAFNAIIQDIVSRDSTFTSPGATVNQFNRLTHRSEIYFSVFKPLSNPLWPGNLKRYKLLGDPAVISDANDQEAIDNLTGFFKTTAKSVWSSSIDGADVSKGGAANELPIDPVNRNVYTYLENPSSGTANKQLTNDVNELDVSNADITAAMLNAADAADRTQVLRWARGHDVLDVDGDLDVNEARRQIGDPLHSVPLLVTYGGTDANPDIEIFFGTNEGYLHSVNGETGIERFAFMPEEFLGQLDTLYDNSGSYSHPYGFDGSPVAWVQDLNFDNAINGADKVYLYQGMRRGGRNYYALNVTNRDAPELLWKIEGGSTEFMELGYTWSQPVKTRVKMSGYADPVDVLLFAGGFDPVIDASPNARVNATMGNVIYMVDANTGQRLWMASPTTGVGDGLQNSDMKYAIPSDLAVVDINADGLADQFYVGDTGGQIWRFDIHHGEPAASLVTGGVIADLGGASGVDFRRFYFKPDVSMFVQDSNPRLAISIGSGAINEPLEQASLNRFYVIFQQDVFGAPATYTKLTHLQLTNRTDDLSETKIANEGWFIDLEAAGEKVLAASITVNNQIIFTSYAPTAAVSACSGVTGAGAVYVVNLYNGNPVHNLQTPETIDKVDRQRALKAPSIPPTPKMLFPAEMDGPTILIGPEQPLQDLDFGINAEWQRTYWYEPN